MKNKIIYIAIFIGLFGLTACNGMLDLDPITEELETNFYKNEEQCLQGLVSTYDVLGWGAVATPGTGAASIPFEWISEVLGDKCYAGGDNATDAATMERFNRGQLNGDISNVRALWKKYYTGIYRANLLLEKLPSAEFTDESNRVRFEAEAKFLRAYFYFDLVRLFGNVPLILKVLSSKEYIQEQASPAAVYEQIATDLQAAINVLQPYNQLPTKELGRATKSSAQGLMMRVWLYYTGYYGESQLGDIGLSNILATSEDLINRSGHSLLNDYGDLFSPNNKNNQESVFEIQFSTKANAGWDNNNREVADGNLAVLLWSMRLNQGDKSKYADGWSFAPIKKDYYKMFNDADARKKASFVVPSEEGVKYKAGFQDSGIFPRKWSALKEYQSDKGDVRVNYPYNNPVIRFSDVLLMASELNLLSGGDPSKALLYYTKVRQRSLGTSTSVPNVSLDLLDTERELEFACEGIRYWDLMRRGIDTAKKAIDETDPSGNDVYTQRFNYEAKGLLPIPTSEIINSNYTLKQNIGY